MPWKKQADRDLWKQVQAIKPILATMAQSVSAASQAKEPSQASQLLFDEATLNAHAASAVRQTQTGRARDTLVAALSAMANLGPRREVTRAPSPDVLKDVRLSFPHFDEVTLVIEQQIALARLGRERLLRLKPILLDGPPGVGKTAFVRRIASTLGAPFHTVAVPQLTAGWILSGLDLGFESGRTGLVWRMLQHTCMSPVVLLDELDKTSRSDEVYGVLLALLEPSTARCFVDEATRFPVDASWIGWIATCNDANTIEPALRSRLLHVRVNAPTKAQMPAVALSVVEQCLANAHWGKHVDPHVPADVLAALCSMSAREISQSIETAYANAAMDGRRTLRPSDLPRPHPGYRRAIGFIPSLEETA